MAFYQLFKNVPQKEPKKILDASFESPYESFEALRQMSYAMQAAGVNTKVDGSVGEAMLVLPKGVNFVFILNSGDGDGLPVNEGNKSFGPNVADF